jgi:hypothetical protein
MLYRINFVTKTTMTIEADSLYEAESRMISMVEDMNKHSHHGEVTTATLQVKVNVGTAEEPNYVWGMLSS